MHVAFIEIVVILILVFVNGLFAMAEISLISARKTRLQKRARDGDRGAIYALKLMEEPTGFLSTVQVWITLVGILAGAFGGATVAEELGLLIGRIPGLTPYAEFLGVAIVVLVITYLTLIFGELVPKRLALINPEGLAARAAFPMSWLAKILSPVVRFLSSSTELVVRFLGVHQQQEPPVTVDEIKGLLEAGTRAGVFQKAEQEMVAGVFRMGDWRISSLVTPRTEIVWLDIEDEWEENLRKIKENPFSKYPVARGNLDNVVGICVVRELFAVCIEEREFDFKSFIHEPLILPESMPVFQVVDKLRKAPVRLALIIDEFGGLLGLVTDADILDAVIGNMLIDGIPELSEIVQSQDGSWLVDGMLSIEEMKDHFHIRSLPEEDKAGYETVGGLIMAYLGKIPKTADRFELGDYEFEVLDMDGFRVDKVKIKLIPIKKESR